MIVLCQCVWLIHATFYAAIYAFLRKWFYHISENRTKCQSHLHKIVSTQSVNYLLIKYSCAYSTFWTVPWYFQPFFWFLGIQIFPFRRRSIAWWDCYCLSHSNGVYVSARPSLSVYVGSQWFSSSAVHWASDWQQRGLNAAVQIGTCFNGFLGCHSLKIRVRASVWIIQRVSVVQQNDIFRCAGGPARVWDSSWGWK